MRIVTQHGTCPCNCTTLLNQIFPIIPGWTFSSFSDSSAHNLFCVAAPSSLVTKGDTLVAPISKITMTAIDSAYWPILQSSKYCPCVSRPPSAALTSVLPPSSQVLDNVIFKNASHHVKGGFASRMIAVLTKPGLIVEVMIRPFLLDLFS